jgi:NAD kinase
MADSNLRRVGVVLKTNSPEARELGKRLLDELERLDLEAVVERETAAALDVEGEADREELPNQVDLVVVLGAFRCCTRRSKAGPTRFGENGCS